MRLVVMSEPRFGRYRVIAPIARGGMAEVFAGELTGEAGFSRPVAIKSIRPDLVEDPAYVTMFLDEARLAANVQSPHVVHTFDLGRSADGVPYMVMELVVGATLSQLLRACRPRPLPLPFAIEILLQALKGLEDAHSAVSPRGDPLRLVHRDLAPKNILVGIDGRTRIMDFGVAHAVERLTRTTTGQVKGTIRYLSPEQADLQTVDQRSDIFSMGIVAFEMLTGTRLFEGHGMIEIYRQVMSQPIPDVRDYVPETPAEVAGVVAKALARDRRARWQRAGDFARALADVGTLRATEQELQSFVRTNLPPQMRELRTRLRQHAMQDPRSVEIELDVLFGTDDEEPTRAVRGSREADPDREAPTEPIPPAKVSPGTPLAVSAPPHITPRDVADHPPSRSAASQSAASKSAASKSAASQSAASKSIASKSAPSRPASKSAPSRPASKSASRPASTMGPLLLVLLVLGLGSAGYLLARAGLFDGLR